MCPQLLQAVLRGRGVTSHCPEEPEGYGLPSQACPVQGGFDREPAAGPFRQRAAPRGPLLCATERQPDQVRPVPPCPPPSCIPDPTKPGDRAKCSCRIVLLPVPAIDRCWAAAGEAPPVAFMHDVNRADAGADTRTACAQAWFGPQLREAVRDHKQEYLRQAHRVAGESLTPAPRDGRAALPRAPSCLRAEPHAPRPGTPERHAPRARAARGVRASAVPT